MDQGWGKNTQGNLEHRRLGWGQLVEQAGWNQRTPGWGENYQANNQRNWATINQNNQANCSQNHQYNRVFWGRSSKKISNVSFVNFQAKEKVEDDKSGFESLFLLNTNYQNELFQFLPKLFTITTNNGSSKFNTEMLRNASRTISDSIRTNAGISEYKIEISDENNVLDQISQLFQGNRVSFTDENINVARQIIKNLRIINCPNFLKVSIINKNPNPMNQNQEVEINHQNFNNFLIDNFKQEFIIATRKKEYKCRLFAVYSSLVIRDLLMKNPELNQYNYDYEDEFNEFEPICDILNFKNVTITRNNMDSIKEIINDLQIKDLQEIINNFIDKYDEITEKVYDQQKLFSPADEIFNSIYRIKELSVQTVMNIIIQSDFVETKDNISELAAIIIQVIKADFSLHKYLLDLILELDKGAEELPNLKYLIPIISRKLLFILGISKEVSSFVYFLYKRGKISLEDLLDHIKSCYLEKDQNFKSVFLINKDKISNINTLCNININSWFLQEMIDNGIKPIALNPYLSSFIPDKLNEYNEIRDKGEPNNEISIAIRNDDVDKLQSIISKIPEKSIKFKISFSIYDSICNEASYIDYAAFYGSIKCFKFLLLNNNTVNCTTFEYAIYGGNVEIIKIIDQKQVKNINKMNLIIPSIIKHQDDLFDWIFEQKFTDNDDKDNYIFDNLVKVSIKNGNTHALLQIIDKGYNIMKCFNEVADLASANGFLRILQLLCNINSEGKNNLTFSYVSNAKRSEFAKLIPSLFYGNTSIFKMFVDKISNEQFQYAFYYSVILNDFDLVKYFFEVLDQKDFILTNDTIFESLKALINTKLLDLFEYLIDKINPVDSKSFKGLDKLDQLILSASINNKFEIVKKLTELVLSKNPNEDFSDPFIQSFSRNHFNICQYFIEKKVFINYTKFESNINMFTNINEQMLSLFINIPEQTRRICIQSNLCMAIKSKNAAFTEYLFKEGAFSNSALIEAVNTNDINIVNIVLKYKNSPDFINQIISNQGTALSVAARHSYNEIFKRLLEIPGINPSISDAYNETPLMLAMKNSNDKIISYILDFYGDDLNKQAEQLNQSLRIFLDTHFKDQPAKNETQPSKSISQQSSKTYNIPPKNIFTYPRKTFNKKNNNAEKETNVSTKCSNELIAILKRILKVENIDLNSNSKGFSLLFYACKTRQKDIFEILIKSNKVEVNVIDQSTGNTPLLYTLLDENQEFAKMLIEYPQTNINHSNFENSNALLIAIEKNFPDIIDLLLNNERLDPEQSRLNFAFYKSSPEISKKMFSIKSLDVNYIDFSKKFKLSFRNDDNCQTINYTNKLLEAICNKNVDMELIDSIIQHPSFDKDKSLAKIGIIKSIFFDQYEIFLKLISLYDNDVNIINQNGSSILVIAATQNNQKILSYILNNENFDCNKSQILYAFSESFSSVEIHEIIYNYIKDHSKQIIFDNLLPDGDSIFISILSKLRKNNIEEKYYISAFELLLQNGCDPNIPNRSGYYPLEKSIIFRSKSLINVLINSHKINFTQLIPSKTETRKEDSLDKIISYEAESYLHLAIKNVDLLDELLKRKLIDINIPDSHGDTALMKACRMFLKDSVVALFKYDDLDYLRHNKNGKDVLTIISEQKIDPNLIDTKEKYLRELLSQMTLKKAKIYNFSNSKSKLVSTFKSQKTSNDIINKDINTDESKPSNENKNNVSEPNSQSQDEDKNEMAETKSQSQDGDNKTNSQNQNEESSTIIKESHSISSGPIKQEISRKEENGNEISKSVKPNENGMKSFSFGKSDAGEGKLPFLSKFANQPLTEKISDNSKQESISINANDLSQDPILMNFPDDRKQEINLNNSSPSELDMISESLSRITHETNINRPKSSSRDTKVQSPKRNNLNLSEKQDEECNNYGYSFLQEQWMQSMQMNLMRQVQFSNQMSYNISIMEKIKPKKSKKSKLKKIGEDDPFQILPHDIQLILKQKSSRDPSSRFSSKFHTLLNYVSEHPGLDEKIGCAWVTDDTFRINKKVLVRIMGIKVNTLNADLHAQGYKHQKHIKGGWTIWKKEGITKNSTDFMEINQPIMNANRQESYSLKFNLGKISAQDFENFRAICIKTWNEITGNDGKPVPTQFFIKNAATRFKQPEQPQENAEEVLLAIFSLQIRAQAVTFTQFCKFMAMFGPEDTIMPKIASLLICSNNNQQWLYFSPPSLPDRFSGVFDDKEPNKLVLRNSPSIISQCAWNLPLVSAKENYIVDDKNNFYKSWEDYFNNCPFPNINAS